MSTDRRNGPTRGPTAWPGAPLAAEEKGQPPGHCLPAIKIAWQTKNVCRRSSQPGRRQSRSRARRPSSQQCRNRAPPGSAACGQVLFLGCDQSPPARRGPLRHGCCRPEKRGRASPNGAGPRGPKARGSAPGSGAQIWKDGATSRCPSHDRRVMRARGRPAPGPVVLLGCMPPPARAASGPAPLFSARRAERTPGPARKGYGVTSRVKAALAGCRAARSRPGAADQRSKCDRHLTKRRARGSLQYKDTLHHVRDQWYHRPKGRDIGASHKADRGAARSVFFVHIAMGAATSPGAGKPAAFREV